MIQTERKHDQRISAIHKLRVNVKSLAAESRLIRQEERRCGECYRSELSEHRRGRLREEARYAQLALAHFRGRPYKSVEAKCLVPVDAKRLFEKAKRYMYLDPLGEKAISNWLTI